MHKPGTSLSLQDNKQMSASNEILCSTKTYKFDLRKWKTLTSLLLQVYTVFELTGAAYYMKKAVLQFRNRQQVYCRKD